MEAQEFQPKLEELARMRKSAVVNTLHRSETSLELLFRYCDQISALESKLPVAEQYNIPFKWKNAFDKDGLFSGRMSLTGNSLAFERACVLFNIGALLSQIAAGEHNFHNDDGLKRAAELYQQAAGVFLYLKDDDCIQKGDPTTPDLHPATLIALQTLMLGQAEEVFYIKARFDGGSKEEPRLMAKISAQVSEFYAEASKQLMQGDGLVVRWISRVAGKQDAFHALSQYYQGMVAKATRDYGEQLARLKYAQQLMLKAKKCWKAESSHEKTRFPYNHELKLIAHEFDMIQNDNNSIHHARIPEVKALAHIVVGRAAAAPLSKPTTTQLPLSRKFKDMFESLMPLRALHTAINAHNARFAEAVSREVSTLREQTQLMNTTLASMRNLVLPAAAVEHNELPDSTKRKLAAVQRDAGGVVLLRDRIRALPDNLQRNRKILDDCMRLLKKQDELASSSDRRQLRSSQFKERTPSETTKLTTEPLMLEISKYRAVLENASKADSIVREKYQKNEHAFDLLSKSEQLLSNGLPLSSGGGGESVLDAMRDSGVDVLQQLQSLLEELDTVKAERQAMETELKPMQLDMRDEFMRIVKLHNAQHAATPNLDAVSIKSIEQRLRPMQRQVRESVKKQEQLMDQVERAFQQQFQQQQKRRQSSNVGGGSRSRDHVLKELTTGHNAFFALKSQLEERIKFYADLTELLLKLRTKIGDFIFACNTNEKDDLTMKASLQSDIVVVNRKAGDASKMPISYQPTHDKVDLPGKKRNARQCARPSPPRSPSVCDSFAVKPAKQYDVEVAVDSPDFIAQYKCFMQSELYRSIPVVHHLDAPPPEEFLVCLDEPAITWDSSSNLEADIYRYDDDEQHSRSKTSSSLLSAEDIIHGLYDDAGKTIHVITSARKDDTVTDVEGLLQRWRSRAPFNAINTFFTPLTYLNMFRIPVFLIRQYEEHYFGDYLEHNFNELGCVISGPDVFTAFHDDSPNLIMAQQLIGSKDWLFAQGEQAFHILHPEETRNGGADVRCRPIRQIMMLLEAQVPLFRARQ